MKIWKKFLALLVAVLIMMSVTPAVMATETEETEETSATTETTVVKANGKHVDYSSLEKLVATASGLNGYEYTAATWKPLQDAVEEGKVALKKKYAQWKVNAISEKIEECRNALVKMDYTQLEDALRKVYVLIDENPQLHDAWRRMDIAVEKAKPLLVSGDQAAVDAIVVELNGLMEELAKLEVKQETTEIVVVEEVEVEVLPTSEYCNVPMHRTWPVLFAVSAVLNVGLVILLVYVLIRKRNTTDDTPLVSYNIDDDMDL